jgi:hypothetical protein
MAQATEHSRQRPNLAFDGMARQHVKVSINYTVRYGINGPSANVTRLQFWCVWRGLFVAQGTVLSGDDIKSVPCVPITAKLKVRILQIIQGMEIA